MNYKIYKNPNEKELEEIVAAVEANEGYCPCALEKNEETKCVCRNFRELTDVDFCHCGRYYKVGEYETIALIGDVTEGAESFYWWEETLSKQNFIVIPVKIDAHNLYHHSVDYSNLCRSKIHKADVVFILDEDNEWIIDMTTWAECIGKRTLKRSELKNEV